MSYQLDEAMNANKSTEALAKARAARVSNPEVTAGRKHYILEGREPVVFVGNYVLFRLDELNWVVTRHQDCQALVRHTRYFNTITGAAKKLTDLLVAEEKSVTGIKDFTAALQEIGGRVEKALSVLEQ